MTPQQYMTEIVLPTLEEYVADTSSRRKAYLACMVTYHMADYLKAAGVRDPQADMIGSCEGAWRVVKVWQTGPSIGTAREDQIR